MVEVRRSKEMRTSGEHHRPTIASAWPLLLVVQGCSNFIEIKCPPPTAGPVYAYKDCREAFKLYATEWSFKLTESIEGLQRLAKVSAGQELGTKVVKLAQELDQTNIALQNEYVAACSLFNTGPCDPKVRDRYYDEIRAIREQNERLRVIYAKVQELEKAPTPPKTLAIDPRLKTVGDIEDILSSMRAGGVR